LNFEKFGISYTSLSPSYAYVNDANFSKTYFWRVRSVKDADVSKWSETFVFHTVQGVPEVSTLVMPLNGATDVPTSTTLRWNVVPNAVYTVVVSTKSDFSHVISSFNIPSGDKSTLEIMMGGLAPSTTYYWKVQASNSTGSANWSEAFSFTTSRGELAIPTLMVPPNNVFLASSANMIFTWNRVENATSYDIEIAPTPSFMQVVYVKNDVTTTSIPVALPLENARYFWRVRAKSALQSSPWSPAFVFQVGESLSSSTPNSPALLNPLNNARGLRTEQSLVWEKVQNAISYDIELSPTPQFYTVIVKNNNLFENQTTISNLSPGMTYYWRVRSNNDAGASSWSESYNFSTGVAPYAPMLSMPENGASGITENSIINWDRVEDAKNYHVQVSLTSTFNDNLLDRITSTTFTNVTLPLNQMYFWRVRAQNDMGFGTWSAWRNFTTQSTTTSVEELTFNVLDVKATPNPATDISSISYTVPQSGMVSLMILDMMGRQVSTLVHGVQATGTYNVPFDASTLEQGVYVYHLVYNGIVTTGKISVVR